MNQKTHIVINIVSLHVGWFACVLGATSEYPLVGPVVVAALVALHLVLTQNWRREFVLIMLVGVLGTVADSIQMAAGTLAFQTGAGSSVIVPLWIIALWLNFATGLQVALRFLSGRVVLASVFGFLGGASAYYGGARLGALAFPIGGWQGAALVGLEWSVLMPLMARLASVLRNAGTNDPSQRQVGLSGHNRTR